MSTLERRTPDDLLDELADIVDRLQARLPAIRAALDQLASFRLPSGQVAFETVHADDVVAGDWVQRCYGDPDWHLVEDVDLLASADCYDWVRITHDGLAHDWKATDAIRVARPTVDIIATQGDDQ